MAAENVDFYARISILLIQEDDLPIALEYTERGRGILSRDELRSQPVDFRGNLDDQTLLLEEETLRLAVLEAQNLVDALNRDLNTADQAKQDAQAALEDAQDTYDRHIERMQLQGGFLSRELALDVASLEEIQVALPDDTTLLLYGINPVGSYALLVTANDLRGFTLDAGTDQIDEAVRRFATDRRANADALRDLYDLVFAPITNEITTSHLIISPDGVLNYVPFAALQAPDGHYLIDDYAISMIPSGTTLVLLKDRQNTPAIQPILAMSQRSAPPLPALTHADSEVRIIADLFQMEAVTNATEADLRTQLAGRGILHISAHAELNPFAPLYSVIHLAPDEAGQYDGRLEVREIYELDLSATELVILSGCDTRSGGDGEDFGLINRAFFGAGAQKVVSSLWSVDDEATAMLLTAFMEARLSGTYSNDADALQAAMIKIKDLYPDQPCYWASFVLTGLPD